MFSEFHLGKRGKKNITNLLVKKLRQLKTEPVDNISSANIRDKDTDDEHDIDSYWQSSESNPN